MALVTFRRVAAPAAVSCVLAAAALAQPAPSAVGKPPQTQNGQSVADAVTGAVERVKKALPKRDWAGVADASRRAGDAASILAGLRFSFAAITAGPHRGRGVYEPAKDGVVSGRHLYAVLEVDGVVPEPLPDGRLRHTLEVSGTFAVVGESGVLDELGVKDLGTHQVTSTLPLVQQTVGVDVVLGDVPAGDYAVTFEVTEPTTKQRAAIPLRFVVR